MLATPAKASAKPLIAGRKNGREADRSNRSMVSRWPTAGVQPRRRDDRVPSIRELLAASAGLMAGDVIEAVGDAHVLKPDQVAGSICWITSTGASR